MAFQLVAVAVLCRASARAEEKNSENVVPASARRVAMGVGSCSAQPCHGSVKPDPAKIDLWQIHGDEVTVWIERDPHAQAYRVLANDLSQQIADRLKLGVPATQAERCLRCHSPYDVSAAGGGAAALTDGVGCEACHGAAQDWLKPHTIAGWRQKSPREKQSLGLRETRNLQTRTRACAACHVGAAPKEGEPGDDVDHDLIAAGHPALKFELTAYLAKMPKHWDERLPGTGNQRAGADFEAQAWAVGQAASAAAALDLLSYRAGQRGKKPWPEFAEYDCYSCHHQLYGKRGEARLEQPDNEIHDAETTRDPTRLGLPTWGTWYLSLAGAVPQAPGKVAEALDEALDQVERMMQSPRGDRAKLSRTAREAARQFDAWAVGLAAGPTLPVTIGELLARLKREAPRLSVNWDGEAQLYLALVALHYARHGAQPPPVNDPVTRSLRETREQLMFPVTAGGERRFDSPRNLDPAAALRQRLLPEIERLLEE